MNRRNRTMIVVGLAVVLATLASFLVYRAIQSIPVREVTIVERQMVVATQRIEAGVSLAPDQLRLTPWPADSVVPGSFERIEDAIGRGVGVPILPNEPVTESKLMPVEAGAGGVGYLVPEGMLAVAVRTNDVIGVAGFILPGSRVDVIAVANPDQRGTISKRVLMNVEVLSVEQDTSVPPEQRSRSGSVLTLILTPADTEKLALAASQGQIQFALRNSLDAVVAETDGVRMQELFSSTSPQPQRQTTPTGRTRVVQSEPPPPARPPTVDIILGAQRRTEEVKPTQSGGGGSAGGAGSR